MKTESTQAKLEFRHKQMLELQEEIFPFTPTVRDLMETWGDINSTSAVVYVLEQLREQGKVITRISGKSRKYYAI